MNKTEIKAEVVADSISPQGDRLTSLLITFPRIILAEINTHRMLSKNTSSSRAIPFKKMVEAVQNDPFIPIAWQKEHKGMQGSEYFNLEESNYAKRDWLDAKRFAVDVAQRMHKTKVTKQLCNRLLEPFMWTTMLITGSREGWQNFFNLRSPEYHLENVPTVNEDLSLNSKTLTLVGKSKKELLKQINEIDSDSYTGFKTIINNYSDLDWFKLNKGQAEIHMMMLSEKIYDAMNESTPKQLKAGEWHIPFEDKIDLDTIEQFNGLTNSAAKIKISTAMAAHTSYTTVGNEPVKSYEKWIELHDKLIAYNPPHSSPMEHCARAMDDKEYDTFVKGKITDRRGVYDFQNPYDYAREESIFNRKKVGGWCNNLKGFIPYRYMIDNHMKII